MIISVYLVALLQVVIASQDQIVINDEFNSADTFHDALVTSGIIPQILDDFQPSLYPNILYPKYETVTLGNDVPIKHVAHRPIFTLSKLWSIEHDPTKTYTLILTDPDATSRDNPKWSEMCHWILTNITAPSSFDIEYPAEIVSYLPPSPPKKTGPHRYVFVLLEGETYNLTAPKERKHWGYGKIRHGVRDWAIENGLKVVGANFFYAQHHKQ